ncbi:MAG: hypothetical protein HRT61_04310 [Ekhidna sp.]|nr:hypothetical protein [Ekhidna sp.]
MHLVIHSNKSLLFLSFFLGLIMANSQTIAIQDYVIATNNLRDPECVSVLRSEISKSQFIIIGEEHGYKENSEITDFFFELSQPLGFNYLCIETDSIAAYVIEGIAQAEDPIASFRALNEHYPISIPFYNSPDDYTLFKKVVSHGGEIWGIDQSFMTQFRLNFSKLIETSRNESLKAELIKLEKKAHAGFGRALANRDFQAPFIFQYSDSLHNSLLSLSQSPREKRVLDLLRKSKEIYSYNFANRQYKNNLYRSYLMKDNFLSYYRKSQTKNSTPKVIFKLGANHTARGLNSTNVYDIANLLSELAVMNEMSSTHIYLKGIKGSKAIANPFSPSPTKSYNNESEIPAEVKELIKASDFKYFVLDLKPLREQAEKYSDKLAELVFKFDVAIFVDNTMASPGFK